MSVGGDKESGSEPSPMARAGRTTIGGLLAQRARIDSDAPAVIDGNRRLSFGQFNERVNRVANGFHADGIRRGDRIAILARNCAEYLEAEFAAAKTGAILCALNWRLADAELAHCINLVSPKALILGPEYDALPDGVEGEIALRYAIGPDWEARLAAQSADEPDHAVDPEDGLFILYTSGTTGLPKGALISHRALIARAQVFQTEIGVRREDAFIAWAPYYHMASTDQSIATLLMGGRVHIVEGYQASPILDIIENERIGWLVLIPGMIDQFIADCQRRKITPKGIHCLGAMADLVPPHQIAEVTALMGAPYVNSFGSTETGLPPATASFLAVGEVPTDLGKRISGFCEVRLVDENNADVTDGEPGEMAVRGPTLFSGYWNADAVNAHDFRGGWFHLGDVFARDGRGRIGFVDRVKYMIKSGGENVYPAEIERVLMAQEGVIEAAVIRKRDDHWGEVPIAFVARKDDSVGEKQLMESCRAQLAGYKQPKEIHFIAFEKFPRSTSGKVQRHEMEHWIKTD